jgi:general secretion pathway protein G
VIGTTQLEAGGQGYPPSLDLLVEGVPMAGDAADRTLRFLRRIPVDPMTGAADWGLRAYQDPPLPTTWGGGSVFDVYSRSLETALDGSRYREW